MVNEREWYGAGNELDLERTLHVQGSWAANSFRGLAISKSGMDRPRLANDTRNQGAPSILHQDCPLFSSAITPPMISSSSLLPKFFPTSADDILRKGYGIQGPRFLFVQQKCESEFNRGNAALRILSESIHAYAR